MEITGWNRESLLSGVADLNRQYREQGRAFAVEEVAGGYLIFTLPEYAGWVRKLKKKEEENLLTPAALETLAIIAYRQPITRAEIDAVRGVQSSAVLGSLLDRRLVRIPGRSEALGRPLLYGTTREFLKQFGLACLKDLPKVEEFKELASPPPPAPEGTPDAELPAPGTTGTPGIPGIPAALDELEIPKTPETPEISEISGTPEIQPLSSLSSLPSSTAPSPSSTASRAAEFPPSDA